MVRTSKGMYLISNNGYLSWLTIIESTTLEGFFSTNLESVQKDVECTFGILKKLRKVLNNGVLFHGIAVCEKMFTTCCCLHNFLLDLMERSKVCAGRGGPLTDDGFF